MATQTPEQATALELVRKRHTASEPVHKEFQEHGENLFRRYRHYRRDKDRYGNDWPNDQYPSPKESTDTWGARFRIPYAYSTVETVLPRLISQHPQPLLQPLEDGIDENVANMKSLLTQQFLQIDAEVTWQQIAKDGLILNLGVAKGRWRKETRSRIVMRPPPVPKKDSPLVVPTPQVVTVFDDPTVERVDPFDFFWDPMACSIEDCEYVIHRLWRSHDYVLKQFEPGADGSPPRWSGVDPSKLTEGAGRGQYEMAHEQRWAAMGRNSGDGRKDIHEVWEYHDHVQQRVITVLDRQHVVRNAPNPYHHGELPFAVFRPSIVGGELVGIGEVDPIEDLCDEMDTLRRQRRDNATLVLQRVGFYSQGLFDEDDIKWGPGQMNAVPGDPSQAVYFPQIGDIPGSSYRESAEIAQDIDMTSGLGDAIRGIDSSGNTTATTSQITQAAANARIDNKAFLLLMAMRRIYRQWMLMDQQFITEADQKTVLLEQQPQPGQYTPKYLTKKMGPLELMGDMAMDLEAGSQQPANPAQDLQEATALLNAARNDPHIDQRLMWRYVLKRFQISQPDSWIVPANAVPPEALDMLKEMHPELAEQIDWAVQRAQGQDVLASQQAQGDQQAAPEAAPPVAA